MFQLEELLTKLLLQYQFLISKRNIRFQIIDDIASHITIAGHNQKMEQLLHMVFQNSILHSGATVIQFSTRPLVRHEKEIWLEFSIEEKDGLAKKSFSYYRSILKARTMVEEMNGKSQLDIDGNNASLKFIVRCNWINKIESSVSTNLNLTDKKILVAEDNEVNQKQIKSILQKKGAWVDVVSNGKEVVDNIERSDYDVILMDLHMPCMNGFDAAKFLRRKLKCVTPIIGMTAGNPEDLLKSIEAGIDDYIKKPFTEKELLSQILVVLATKSRENALIKTA